MKGTIETDLFHMWDLKIHSEVQRQHNVELIHTIVMRGKGGLD